MRETLNFRYKMRLRSDAAFRLLGRASATLPEAAMAAIATRTKPNAERSPRQTQRASAEAIRGFDQLVGDTGLKCRMARIGHNAQIRFGPYSMQVPGAARRTDDIVSTLHDD